MENSHLRAFLPSARLESGQNRSFSSVTLPLRERLAEKWGRGAHAWGREKFLDISNGYIAQITDKSMQQISIAICKYDTGDFLLMATPVIYTSF